VRGGDPQQRCLANASLSGNERRDPFARGDAIDHRFERGDQVVSAHQLVCRQIRRHRPILPARADAVV
jgi:hypothetical protein